MSVNWKSLARGGLEGLVVSSRLHWHLKGKGVEFADLRTVPGQCENRRILFIPTGKEKEK